MTAADEQRSYRELAAICARLEAEAAHHLVGQQDLIRAKDHLDRELHRFRAIQAYIAGCLHTEDLEEFQTLTLEAIIEAFEFETALFLLAGERPDRLAVAAEFGFDEVPEDLAFDPAWTAQRESAVLAAGHPMLAAWPELDLAQAIVCPFDDKDGAFCGLILGGITQESGEFFEPISEEHCSAFTVHVQQAGSLWVKKQLNDEILARNRRLVELTESYSRFVPFQFLDLLKRESIEDIDAGDHVSLDMSVLFADIRDFTPLSENIGAADAFAFLNRFLAAVEPAINQADGFINQYLGDALMALFAGPADAPLICAGAMMEQLRAFNAERRERGEAAIRIGIGINSGPLMLGAIGGGRRLDSNVVGDTANLASRTENLTKLYGAAVLFTGQTLERVADPSGFSYRELDRVVVKGRAEPVTLYELLDADPEAVRRDKLATRELFERALADYRAGHFLDACQAFEACQEQAPGDRTAALYVGRCEHNVAMPPAADWTGISVLDRK